MSSLLPLGIGRINENLSFDIGIGIRSHLFSFSFWDRGASRVYSIGKDDDIYTV